MSDIVSPGGEAQFGQKSLVLVAMANSDYLDPTYFFPPDVVGTVAWVVCVVRDEFNPKAAV
jgi:hypothetical protein